MRQFLTSLSWQWWFVAAAVTAAAKISVAGSNSLPLTTCRLTLLGKPCTGTECPLSDLQLSLTCNST